MSIAKLPLQGELGASFPCDAHILKKVAYSAVSVGVDSVARSLATPSGADCRAIFSVQCLLLWHAVEDATAAHAHDGRSWSLDVCACAAISLVVCLVAQMVRSVKKHDDDEHHISCTGVAEAEAARVVEAGGPRQLARTRKATFFALGLLVRSCGPHSVECCWCRRQLAGGRWYTCS